MSGPYVDYIQYEIITDMDDQVQALIAGQIDLIGSSIDASYFDQLNNSEDIEILKSLENGYTFLTLNCEKYPLNITEYRKALAIAVDKNRMVNDSYSGLAQPLDGVIPSQNPFSIESSLNKTYYVSNVTIAKGLLESAGFNDKDDDGWLEGPGALGPGTVELENITIEGLNTIENEMLMQVVTENLAEIGILAEVKHTSNPEELQSKVYNHSDYDIILFQRDFEDFKIDWLPSEFGSEFLNISGYNIANFANTSFDSFIPVIAHSVDIQSILQASHEMQEILVEECPYIPCYQKFQLFAMRPNRIQNITIDSLSGVGGWWTNYRIQLNESGGGPIGGTVIRSLSSNIDNFNFMMSSSEMTLDVLGNLYDPLLMQTPDGEIIPWLAESYSIQNHNDSSSILEGNTRITFYLSQKATWSDSHPISAYDIAFSMNYMRDSGLFNDRFSELYAAYAKNDYTFVVEFSNQSYWYIYDFLDLKVIPKHRFIDIPTPTSWIPNLDDPADPIFVTSGPFMLSSYSQGESLLLKKNLKYYRLTSDSSSDVYSETSLKKVKSSPSNYIPTYSEHFMYSYYMDTESEIFWTSNDMTVATPITNHSYLHGDHVTINAAWSNTSTMNAKLEFYSGIISKKTQSLVIPNPAYNPYVGVIDVSQFSWIYVDNIKQNEYVNIVADFNNSNCDIMAWWADTDNGTWKFSNNLLGSSMITDIKPENGSFIASRDGELAIGCFDFDLNPGIWTITVTSGSKYIVGPVNNHTLKFDTYSYLNDGTWSIRFSGKINETPLIVVLVNVTISNSFAPVVEILTPNGGQISGNYGISWNSTDINVDDILAHEVRVSNDGGVTFMLLATHYNDSSIIWNQTGWIRLSSYVVKVIASDGVLLGSDTSDSNVTAGDPLINDFDKPIILGPKVIIFEYTNETITLSWLVSDFHANEYTILLNDTPYEIGIWSSGNLTIQFENYTIGIYNFTVIVNDTSSNRNSLNTILIIFNATSATTITTTSTTTPTTTTTTSSITTTTTTTPINGFLILTGSVIIICSTAVVIVLYLFYQKRIHLRNN